MKQNEEDKKFREDKISQKISVILDCLHKDQDYEAREEYESISANIKRRDYPKLKILDFIFSKDDNDSLSSNLENLIGDEEISDEDLQEACTIEEFYDKCRTPKMANKSIVAAGKRAKGMEGLQNYKQGNWQLYKKFVLELAPKQEPNDIIKTLAKMKGKKISGIEGTIGLFSGTDIDNIIKESLPKFAYEGIDCLDRFIKACNDLDNDDYLNAYWYKTYKSKKKKRLFTIVAASSIVALVVTFILSCIGFIPSELYVSDVTLMYGEDFASAPKELYTMSKFKFRGKVNQKKVTFGKIDKKVGKQEITVKYGLNKTTMEVDVIKNDLAIKEVVFSEADNTITWFDMAPYGAVGYKLTINGRILNLKNNFYDLDLYMQENKELTVLDISIVAYGDGIVAEEKGQESLVSYKVIPTAILEMKNGVLEIVNYDSQYTYFLGETKITKTTNMSGLAVGEHTLIVRSTAPQSVSSLSKELLITKLAAPTVSMTNGVFNVDAVAGAASYKILQGVEEFVGQSHDFSAIAAGNYTANAIVIGDGTNTLTSESASYDFTKLAAPNVRIINGMFSVGIVSQATSYKISQGGKEYVGQTRDFRGIEPGKHVAKGKAIGNGANILTSEYASYDFIKLAAPTVSMTNGVFSVGAVADAISYSISKGDIEYVGQTKNFSGIVAGKHIAKSRAIGNGTNIIGSDYSAEYVFNKLTAPTVSMTNGVFNVGAVADATSYKISQGGAEYNGQSHDFSVIAPGNYTAKAIAIGNGTNVLTSEFAHFDFIRLAAPIISMTNGIMKAEAKDAISYKISQAANEYDGQTHDFSAIAAGNHTAKGRAIGNDANIINSDYSAEYAFSKLAAPTVSMTNGVFSVDAVADATSYSISQGDIEYIGQTKNFSGIAAGKHIAKGRAIGNGTNILTSEFASYAFTRLAAPALSMANGVFNVGAVADATSYKISQGGAEYVGQTHDFSAIAPGNYTAKAIAIGNGTKFLTSEFAHFDFIRLAAPIISMTNGIMKAEAKDAISYKISQAANEYDGQTHDFSSIAAGNHTAKGKAIGNDANIINSDYSAEYAFSRLVAPTVSMANGVFSVGAVTDAISYSISQGDIEYIGQTKDFSDIVAGKHIAKGRAIGNGTNMLTSEFASYAFTRLAAPTVSMANGVFNVGAVADATSYKISQGGAEYNGQSHDFSAIAVGNYTAKALAIGNGTNVLTSEYSAEYAFSKPTVVIKNTAANSSRTTLSWDYAGAFNMDIVFYSDATFLDNMALTLAENAQQSKLVVLNRGKGTANKLVITITIAGNGSNILANRIEQTILL